MGCSCRAPLCPRVLTVVSLAFRPEQLRLGFRQRAGAPSSRPQVVSARGTLTFVHMGHTRVRSQAHAAPV